MKVIPFETLYSTEFFISEPMSKPQNWATRGNIYNAIGKPKVSHTLLWFKNCSGVITDSQKNVITVEKNQLAYMAKGIEYVVEFKDTAPEGEDTVVIHFQMTDKSGHDIAPTLTPVVCIKKVEPSIGLAIDMLAEEFRKNVVCTPEVCSVIYKILAEIARKQKRRSTKNKFACIRTGIELLEQDSDMSISDIARACGVSECYFRRLFREYSGENPIDFRQHHRIERAKQLLLSDEQLSVGEVATELHFADIYHFSKTFKKYVGQSPSAFVSAGKYSLEGKEI
ncbi:MAG: helix-turn-helix transcriptional regulator [Clostridia bacterium]|nr:helix-turn-helix transcriptional regulator [Clostridia bacterium]